MDQGNKLNPEASGPGGPGLVLFSQVTCKRFNCCSLHQDLLRVREQDLSAPSLSSGCVAVHVTVCPSDSEETLSVTERSSVCWKSPASPQRSFGAGYAPNQEQFSWMLERFCDGTHMQSGCVSGTSERIRNSNQI